jgi:hypothetical protein
VDGPPPIPTSPNAPRSPTAGCSLANDRVPSARA